MADQAQSAEAVGVSMLQSDLSIAEKLDRARMELLDLSARNRLLNMPRSAKGSRAIEVVDEKCTEIFQLLVRDSRAFTFLPGIRKPGDVEPQADPEEVADLVQPEDDTVNERGVLGRHADTRLQTRLTAQGLQRRLLELYFDARTLEEEQGVNILYLTLGSLKWIDPNNSENIRYAPLLLIPVALERGSAAEKFKLRMRQDDFASNLTLEVFLDRTQGIRLAPFDLTDSFDPIIYMNGVADAVSSKPGWTVQHDDMVLGFFSFAKFLMYRDLDPATWPKNGAISDRALIRGLLREGFPAADGMIPEEAKIDPHISPAELRHIVDSDSSQSLAIHEVRAGRDIVIQGPPGTGKSQTIANIVASAVADGKRVLFVAEKMAALEVVKRRLDIAGVGDCCLELHSNKANKKAVLDELRRTWQLGGPKASDTTSLIARIGETRDSLNAHAERMHVLHPIAGLSAYQVVGHLVRLRQAGEKPNDIKLEGFKSWTKEQFQARHGTLSELADRVEEIGKPSDHLWHGVGLAAISPMDTERLVERITAVLRLVSTLNESNRKLSSRLQQRPALTIESLEATIVLARRVAGAPKLSGNALGSQTWGEQRPQVASLLMNGEQLRKLRAGLRGRVADTAWHSDFRTSVGMLSRLPGTFSIGGLDHLKGLVNSLPRLIQVDAALARALGQSASPTFEACRRLTQIAERVTAAPPAFPEAFAADLWDTGVERALALAEAVKVLESCRSEIGTQLTAAAWDQDLATARATLAARGESFVRYFSGEWREANRRVRGCLADLKLPLQMVLALLDSLARGQAAKRTIEAENAFGASAFGRDWQGERSVSSALIALAEWMRSLKGLGAEPRLAAAKQPDRSSVAAILKSTQSAYLDASRGIQHVWVELSARTSLLGEAAAADNVSFADALAFATEINTADQNTRELMQTSLATVGDRLATLEELATAQDLVAAIQKNEELGRNAFDDAWKAENSDWQTLQVAATWVDANRDICDVAARAGDRDEIGSIADGLESICIQALPQIEEVFKSVALDSNYAFSAGTARQVNLDALQARLFDWSVGSEQLSKWISYRARADLSSQMGCAELVQRIEDGRLTPAGLVPAFEMAYFEGIYRDLIATTPELGRFDGTTHSRLVDEFANLDRERIKAASVEVVRAHHRAIPPREGLSVGPVGVLRGEIQRKRGHMAIRKLMETAGPVVQALKPVFMMSPLSVAQFLPPGAFEFDLLVMDEASQIHPVDALGAVARAKQVVVVGDPKQLPPTAFFAKMTGNADSQDEDEDGAQVADIESILGLFTARGLPARMLRWHYRSKHQSLIAVSNHQFYEGKLFIVPSPYTAEAGMGLRFHRIEAGLFDAGATRTNQVEAKRVAEAIIAHAQQHPNLSLGVAAFSVAQRRAIVDHLELLRRTLPPETEAFFQSHAAEPFFIKNLENVQGDERDVIIISVGYGPTTPGGRVPMRFGPLGQPGGERRLNVLISRAKQRCEVFSSMTDEDIEPSFAQTRKGVFAFRLFLHYARTGRMVMAESTGRDNESVFEEQVEKALVDRGYQVHRQVGLAGFFIDLAVADLDCPGKYLLGIECDGATYHEARSARDRDRLRQSVLESHGWNMHRIWSTDWFNRPQEQLQAVISRLEALKADWDSKSESPTRPLAPLQIVTVERDEVTEIGLSRTPVDSSKISSYIEATLKRPSQFNGDIHQAPVNLLVGMVSEAVEIEGPVHVDEVVDRIRDAWGLARAGGRIQASVEAAVGIAVAQKRIERDQGFLSIPGATVRVRDRGVTNSLSVRKAEKISPSEIKAAIMDVITDNLGATKDDVVTSIARAFGIRAISANSRGHFGAVVDRLLAEGLISQNAGLLVINR